MGTCVWHGAECISKSSGWRDGFEKNNELERLFWCVVEIGVVSEYFQFHDLISYRCEHLSGRRREQAGHRLISSVCTVPLTSSASSNKSWAITSCHDIIFVDP